MNLGFFDTNILVYSDDTAQPDKQERAIKLLANAIQTRSAAISVQVLHEYFVTVTKKLGVDAALAQRKVENFISSMVIVQITESEVVKAIELHRLDRISYWDALIISAARNVKAAVLYSEDLQSGRKFGGSLKIVNPFEET